MQRPANAQQLSKDANDAFRRNPTLGTVVITARVKVMGRHAVEALMALVKNYADFDAVDDPYGEHDFGSITFRGSRFFWKIDYFDERLEFGSEASWDTTKCRRVLTLMHAEDY